MSSDAAKEHALRGAWNLIDGDLIGAARALAAAATAYEALPASARRQLRDSDRLWREMPDDADDAWHRSAVVASLAYRIGKACHESEQQRADDAASQAALL